MDLLLDTVSNTFGGILFLAVLIVILLRFTGRDTPLISSSVAPNDYGGPSELEIATAKAIVDELRTACRQARQNASEMGAAQVKGQYRSYLDLQLQRSELQVRRAKQLTQLSELQVAVRQSQAEAASTLSEAASLKNEIAEVESEILRETAKVSRTTELPSLRNTNKREFPVILRYGRLYAPYSPTGYGESRKRSLGGFVVLDEDDSIVRVTPKPYAGLLLDGGQAMTQLLEDLFENLDEERFYVAIGIWEDSFAEFSELRARLVDLGYEYRVVPIAEDGVIVEGGARDALVQ
ncbi:hypothetical protein [Posidoniimonas corsicana]|uniref:hypothetical protein n=1 Tax=Posidoniimonas corsicana TaxID=1938618 RepID=UPI0011B693BF|nr:hypothetical protein [Posidoniimonas corsicana]